MKMKRSDAEDERRDSKRGGKCLSCFSSTVRNPKNTRLRCFNKPEDLMSILSNGPAHCCCRFQPHISSATQTPLVSWVYETRNEKKETRLVPSTHQLIRKS